MDEPILFRSTTADAYKATLEAGSIWLRSDQYFREIEDKARQDKLEGVNAGKTTVPLRLTPAGGPIVNVCGSGHIGQQIVPHYILSMHGSSIAEAQRISFGGHTFGIKSISRLSAEILYRSSQVLRCNGFRYGAVYYQYTALAQSFSQKGGSAICLGGAPPIHLNPVNTEVLRKEPVLPFILQDEWRIVIFVQEYLRADPAIPLQINVAAKHFYEYLHAAADRGH